MMRIGMALALVLAVGCSKDDGNSEAKGGESAGSAEGSGGEGASEVAKEVDKKLAKFAGGDGDEEKYPFETARIVFEYRGLEQGTVTAWIADHGSTIVLQRDMKKPMAKKSTAVWKDDKATMWNDEQKQVHVTRIRPRDTELTLISTQDPEQLQMAGYEKKPNEEIAGVETEVWHTPKQNVTIWRWNGIDVKYINESLKGTSQEVEAVEIETGVDVPPEIFDPPEGYDVKDMTK